jgi:hypothetical protein
MALKHTLAAGVAAFALLVTPIGLTTQWSDHGPAISTTPAISTAHAAPKRPTSTKAPSSGGPTFTSSGSTQKTTGWQTGQGKLSDEQCQLIADGADALKNMAGAYLDAGDSAEGARLGAQAALAIRDGMSQGCAFTGPNVPE